MPTGPQSRPDVSASSGTYEPAVLGQNSLPTSLSDSIVRRTVPRGRAAVISVGALVVGLAVGLTLREVGTLNFALGEKIAVEVATKQADSAYSTGYDDGKSEGMIAGEEVGYKQGFEAGDTTGYQRGDTAGYERGYDTGLDVGFIDAKTGITPTDAGELNLTAEWMTNIGRNSESGICLASDGEWADDWERWKWAFISPSGSINFMSDTNGYYSCYTRDNILNGVGSLSRYSRLAIYITANGKTDRWGPLPVPSP